MIVSEQHKFAFVGIPRTGTRTLRMLCEPYVPWSLASKDQDYSLPLGSECLADHTPALFLRSFVGPDRWTEYRTFAIVRNPWDRLVSWWHSGYADTAGYTSFTDWVLAGGFQTRHWPRPSRVTISPMAPVTWWLCDEFGQVLVDTVLRFETFTADISRLWTELQLTLPAAGIPHAHSTSHSDYRRYYTAATKQYVAEVYAADCERFQYAF